MGRHCKVYQASESIIALTMLTLNIQLDGLKCFSLKIEIQEGGEFLLNCIYKDKITNNIYFIYRDATDPTKVAGIIGQIFCKAMTAHLDSLVELKINKIGLRVSIDPEQVGFEVGSGGKPLPPSYATELDGALIPVITSNILASIDALLVLELFFHILLK